MIRRNSDSIQKKMQAGDYKRMKNNVMNEIKFIFRPEFLNRIDEILVFHPLTTEQNAEDCWSDVQRTG